MGNEGHRTIKLREEVCLEIEKLQALIVAKTKGLTPTVSKSHVIKLALAALKKTL